MDWHLLKCHCCYDCLCGVVVRVPGYRSRGFRFNSQRCQIVWEAVGLEWGPLSLVSTIEELLGRNSSGSDLENWEYSRGDLLRWPRDTLYPQKLAQTSPTCSGHSVGIVHLRTKTTDFVFCCLLLSLHSPVNKIIYITVICVLQDFYCCKFLVLETSGDHSFPILILYNTFSIFRYVYNVTITVYVWSYVFYSSPHVYCLQTLCPYKDMK
jgi:hypothetical protein